MDSPCEIMEWSIEGPSDLDATDLAARASLGDLIFHDSLSDNKISWG